MMSIFKKPENRSVVIPSVILDDDTCTLSIIESNSHISKFFVGWIYESCTQYIQYH